MYSILDMQYPKLKIYLSCIINYPVIAAIVCDKFIAYCYEARIDLNKAILTN